MKNVDKIDSLIRTKPEHPAPAATPPALHPADPDSATPPVSTHSHPATPSVTHPSGVRPSTSTMSTMISSPDVPAAPELMATPEPADTQEATMFPSPAPTPTTSGHAAPEVRVTARQSPGKSGVR